MEQAMKPTVLATGVCVLVLSVVTRPISPQIAPRVNIQTATGDAIRITSANNHTWLVGPNSGTGSGFGIHDETAASTRLRIDTNGNVGIGASTPLTKLDVSGQIRSSSGGFVFPDGTSQTTAATGGLGAGSGLTLTGNLLSIANTGVTNAMLANAAVTSEKIAAGAVQTANVADGAITTQKLASDALGGVQQIIRGVVTFSTSTDVTQQFS